MSRTVREEREDPTTKEKVVWVRGIERGMVFWAEVFGAQTLGSEQYHDDKPSPWLVVSSNKLHSRYPIIQAVPFTSALQQQSKFPNARILIAADQIKHLPLPQGEVALSKGNALVLTEQLRVMAHERLVGQPIAMVTRQSLGAVEAGIKYVLELP